MDKTTSPQNKSLSIRISSDGLSFCVYSPSETPQYVYRTVKPRPVISLAANLKEALLNEPLLKSAYQRVNVLVTTPSFTTIPAVEFDREQSNDLFHFLFPSEENSHVSYNVLRRSGIAIVFGLDRNIRKLLLDDYPRARFYASASTLVEFFSDKSVGAGHKQMYVYLHDKEMTVYCFHEGRMLFVNTYQVNSVNDCQYYIMNVWEQFGYDQLDDSIEIVSDNDQSQLLADKIQNFIKKVHLIDRSEDFRETITHGSKVIPYDLQTLLVCGY